MPAKEKSRDGTAPSSEQDQSLPRSYDAEQALLGSLILDGSRLNGLIEELGQPLEAQHFYARRHQAVFNGMLKCIEEHADTLDIPVLTAALEKYGLLNEAGGAAYLTQLVERASGGGSLLEYARVIIETARRRALMHAAALIREMGAHPDGRSVEELFDEASGLLMQLSEQSDGRRQGGPREMLSVLSEVFANLQTEAAQQSRLRGVSSGFEGLDNVLMGLRAQSLYILAARPGEGKTTLAMNIVENIALNPQVVKPALIFSLEMPATQLALRMISTFGRVTTDELANFKRIRHENLSQIIRKIRLLTFEAKDAQGLTQQYQKMYIDDSGSLTPLELRARARRLYEMHGGLSIIMVDYLQLMHSPGRNDNRALEVGEISRALKQLSKELNVPVLALSQLRREVESRHDRRPLNSDLRESGALEQDADVIMMIHHPHRREDLGSGEEEAEDADAGADGHVTLMVTKNRHGAPGSVKLLFQPQYTAFYDDGQPQQEEGAYPEAPPAGSAGTREYTMPDAPGGADGSGGYNPSKGGNADPYGSGGYGASKGGTSGQSSYGNAGYGNM